MVRFTSDISRETEWNAVSRSRARDDGRRKPFRKTKGNVKIAGADAVTLIYNRRDELQELSRHQRRSGGDLRKQDFCGIAENIR